MTAPRILAAAVSLIFVSACDRSDKDVEDNIERTAEASASAAGPAEAALGLSEKQLLDADLVEAGGTELGEIVQVLRDSEGRVDRLLVEVEDSNPDRYVHIPIAGLTSKGDGTGWDLVTTMSKQQLASLPAAAIATPGSAGGPGAK